MKGYKIPWPLLITFCVGVLTCYLTLQFQFFDIKRELDVPNIFMNIIGLLIGLYIADTIQTRINKNQNQHNYLENKLDSVWTKFTDLSKNFIYSDVVDVGTISKINHEILHPIENLKSIFNSFEIETSHINDLMIELEGFMTKLPIDENTISLKNSEKEIGERIVSLNKYFSKILKEIQNL